MKKTLYYKLILGYILFALLGILFIEMAGSKMIEKKLIKQKASDLFDQAHFISSDYSLITQKNISDMSVLLTVDVMYIDYNNNIIYSSRRGDAKTNIKDFDITDFGNKTYITGDFYGHCPTDTLSVAMPIAKNYRTDGYIIINYPLSRLQPAKDNIMTQIYLIALALFGFSFVILIIVTFMVYFPVQKLSIAAREYAKGNFSYDGLKKFTGDDEIGRLGVSLNFMASELNTIEEDQKKFIANISHDFRSPLTSIKGYIEAMADGTIPPEMQKKYLDIVLFETDRLTKLTSNLLSLNECDAGTTRLDFQNVNLYELIRPILMSFEGKCSKKKIKFDLQVESRDFIVFIDKGKIEQVIYNLIDNAIKFSHNDSTIFISVKEHHEKIFVSIKDTGIGIPKDSLSKIWDRFYKTDLSRGKDKTGSGLGLAITREIIKNHGENINVISTEGVGTEFVFTLKKVKDYSL